MRVPLCVLLGCVLASHPGPVLAAPAAGAGASGAGDEVRIAVMPVRVDGQVDEATRRSWAGGLRKGLGRGTFELLDQAAVDKLGDATCERKACLDRVRGAKATHLVRTGITMKNRDYLLKLELVDAQTGAVVFDAEERCEICGVGEVTELLDGQGALLQSRLAALGKGPPVLVLDSRPTGAVVYVDGEVVGTTPLERPVLPGARKIRLSLQGYVAEERELTFVAGAREEVVFELQRTPGNPKRRKLGGVALAGGIALVGGGLTLLALDDVPYRRRCSGAEIDADGDCKWLFNTGWAGAALAVSGAVLMTLGIIALVRNRAPKARLDSKQARLWPAGLGVVGRF